ncbi:MAG: ASKHA domain-containing protein [Candidatus Promineifilaceae bacterium]
MSEQPMTTYHVIFMPSGRRGQIAKGTTLLEAARQLGVSIESICGGRMTCNKCRIQVQEGHFVKDGVTSTAAHLSPASQSEQQFLQRLGTPHHRLSCQAQVHGDLLIFVPEESRGNQQVIRKTAVSRTISLQPAVRLHHVQVDPATLGDHRGDWGRMQDALAMQANIRPQTIALPALRQLQTALRQGHGAVTVAIWQQQEVIDVQPGQAKEGVYGTAVDIGTTTIACHLCHLQTGTITATTSAMNPQIPFGEDLMSRISYATTHANGTRQMQTAVLQTINKLTAQAAKEAGIRPRQIMDCVLAGNTTMIHLLLGINPVELGGAPFALANRDSMDIPASQLDLRIHPAARAHILPAQAGHVGADNTAVLLAEAPHQQDKITLIIDVGTNAEIVLGSRQWLFSASSPTGPAFEGAQITHGMRAAPGAIERVRIDPATLTPRFQVIGEPRWSHQWQIGADVPVAEQPQQLAAGICGSGIIEAVAELYLHGILLANGRFNPQSPSPHLQWHGRKGRYLLATAAQSAAGQPIFITQDDIRAIQLAKAALYAGAKLLMKQAAITHVDKILLAGAFGSYIDPLYAMVLGMIPDCDLANVYAIGNAAGDGARLALLNSGKREEARQLVKQVRYVETAVNPAFQDAFVNAIHIPHTRDNFSHIAHLLPTETAVASPPRRPRRRKR